jgi:xylulokinase
MVHDPAAPDRLVAGVDSSTQATKIVVCRADTGQVLREARRPHPEGTEVDPEHWWRALEGAAGGGLLDDVAAIGVGGQQHGMVALDEDGAVVRPALLWNDVRSAGAATDLVDELGGPSAWVKAVGSVPVAALTVTKLRWLAEHEPVAAGRVAEVVLPHDWVTARLAGHDRVRPGTATTDRGDASGTGYWSPAQGTYRTDLLELAFGRVPGTPRVLGPGEVAGTDPQGRLLSVGSGDNMAAALGLGIEPGDVVVSLGTSGTAFGVHDGPAADPSGAVSGFADATGRYLPLVCTLNAARVLTAAASMLDTDLVELEQLALQAPPGAGGLVLLPYLDGERTPDLPFATGTLGGLTRGNATPANVARAAVEGMLCGLADGVDALVAQGLTVHRVVLIGGASRSAAVQEVARQLFGVPVTVPAPAEYVALGAARQAAWALAGDAHPPRWERPDQLDLDAEDAAAGREVRERYRAFQARVHPR